MGPLYLFKLSEAVPMGVKEVRSHFETKIKFGSPSHKN